MKEESTVAKSYEYNVNRHGWQEFMKRYKRFDEMTPEERADLLRKICDEGVVYNNEELSIIEGLGD